jgi:hypothetical protein
MKTILIDPFEQTVTAVDIERGIKPIYNLLGVSCFCIGHYLPDGDAIYVDDEGLFENHAEKDNLKYAFTINNNLLFGKGLVIGSRSTGESEDCKIDVSSLRKLIGWNRYRRTSSPKGQSLVAVSTLN